MNTQHEMVREFMLAFGQEVPKEPCVPSLEIRKLRAKLILEEASELIQALGFNFYEDEGLVEEFEPNLNLLADGLADLHYVAYCGTALACGISNMDEIFAEVHRSNMTKLWFYEELGIAEAAGHKVRLMPTQQSSSEMITSKIGNMHIASLKPVSSRCYLIKDSSGKVIKSPSYSPPNFTVK